nr:putative reverse transcriptase domain-containing protein [Tanacetum cinerariifolium]
EEEEHIASVDFTTVIPVVELVSSPEGTKLVLPPPSIDITTTGARTLVRLQASVSLPSTVDVEERLARLTDPSVHPSPLLLPLSGCLTQTQALRIKSTQALTNAVTAALPPSSIDSKDEIPESERPPRKRSCLFAIGSRYEAGESSTTRPTGGQGTDYGFVSTVDFEARRQEIKDVVYGIKDTWIDTAEAVPTLTPMTVKEVNTRVNLLMGDKMTLQETVWTVEEEAYAARVTWNHSIGLSQATYQELQTHCDHVYTHETHIQTHQTQLQVQLTETFHVIKDMRREMSDMQKELISQREQLRRERQPGPDARFPDHQKVTGDTETLLRNSDGGDGSHSSHAENPRNMHTARPCYYADFMKCHPLNFKGTEGAVGLTHWIKKMEFVFNISWCAVENQGNVKSSKPKTLDETIELANDLMDQKLHTYAERKSDSKRKADDISKNNQGNGCFECGNPGHFKRDCPKLNNKNEGNGNAQGWVYAVGNTERNGNAAGNPDSNVVTSTFLLNNRYASILFDTGADRSFVSNAFSSLIDIIPTPLDNHYDVELADGKIVGINTIIRGFTLNFLNHPFTINLMPVELGSFDAIIGMDWLRRHHAVIMCDEKLVRVPFRNETLVFRGAESYIERESRLTVISCSKVQEYQAKGCHVFLA